MSVAAYGGPSVCDLEPDVDVVWAFLTWWFRDCTAGRIEIGWLDVSGRGLIHFKRFELSEMAEAAFSACDASKIPGQSVYVRASTVNTPDIGNTADVNFVQSPGCWSDLDTPEQTKRAQTVETLVRPSASVITGRIPHLRIQGFFKSDEAIKDAEEIRNLNRRILALYGGDPAVVNPTRLMRLPGTIAWPWKNSRVPELTEFHEYADGRPASYSLATLKAQLPQEHTEAGSVNAFGSKPAALNTARWLMERITAGDNWHNHMIRLVAHWIGRGWSNAEIIAAAHALTLPGYTHDQTIKEVLKAVDGARTKWAKPDQEETLDDTEWNLSCCRFGGHRD